MHSFLFFSRVAEAKTFVPSWRFLSDMSTTEAFTALPGGVSGRRFSSLYTLGIDSWLQCQYKRVRPQFPH
jgi:acyl-homoserine lactone acylase PvdQ